MSTPRHAQLLNTLINLILEAGPGKTLPAQDDLAKRLKVSRTLLREAIVILEYMRVIKLVPKLGTRITDPQTWYVQNEQLRQFQADMLRKQEADSWKPNAASTAAAWKAYFQGQRV